MRLGRNHLLVQYARNQQFSWQRYVEHDMLPMLKPT
jgi:hypothetical protein